MIVLLERSEEIADELRRMGRRALDEASRAGVPAYFMAPELGAGIIRRLPDGTLHRVQVEADGRVIVVEKLDRQI